jgi:hypothetical protein
MRSDFRHSALIELIRLPKIKGCCIYLNKTGAQTKPICYTLHIVHVDNVKTLSTWTICNVKTSWTNIL